MDLKSLTTLFSGSPFRPLLQHRELVLESLLHVNRQIYWLNSDPSSPPPSSQWFSALSEQLDILGHDVLKRLKQPSITSQPKNQIINALQIQKTLARQVTRLSERITFKTLVLPVEMIVPINELTRQFGQTVHQVRQGIQELEQTSRSGFLRPQEKNQDSILDRLALHIDELRSASQKTRHHACQFESHIDPVDVALLFLILDDITDLALGMHSFIAHLKN